jgi:hypothetical protein
VKEQGKRKNEERGARWMACAWVFCTFSFFVFRFSFAQQSTQPIDPIRKHFEDLADADMKVRDAARIALMGLSRQDLNSLRRIVETSRPLAASQALALHDIVTHVYLSGEPNHSLTRDGFLGVRLSAAGNGRLDIVAEQGIDTGEVAGVLIQECMPGFSGFRYLREGDVVQGVIEPVRMRTPQQQDLISAVTSIPPDGTIRLEVLRQGQVMEIALKVSARPPEAANPALTAELLSRRQSDAETYWRENFSHLVSESIS